MTTENSKEGSRGEGEEGEVVVTAAEGGWYIRKHRVQGPLPCV